MLHWMQARHYDMLCRSSTCRIIVLFGCARNGLFCGFLDFFQQDCIEADILMAYC